MNQIFQSLPYCFVYMDDVLVLISSPGLGTHLEHVQSVLNLLRYHGVDIIPNKYIFAVPTVDFLRMRVFGSGCFLLLIKNTEILSVHCTLTFCKI